MGKDGSDGGIKSSDYGGADNRAELEAWKDSSKESPKENKEAWDKASGEAGSFWSSLFGGKK